MLNGPPWRLADLAREFNTFTSQPELTVNCLGARPGGLGPPGSSGGDATVGVDFQGDEELYQRLKDRLTLVPGAAVSAEAWLGEGVSVGAGAVVEPGARLGDRVMIGPCCFVAAGVEVGEECLLEPGAVLMQGVRLGRRVRVASGAILGSDGYGYVVDQGRHLKIPQVGLVEVGDDTVIESGVCIDRATTTITRIGREVRIGSLSQIGHNVQVGDRTVIGEQVGLPGSAHIGQDCRLGWQSGTLGHVELGDGVELLPRCGSMRKKVPPGSVLAGYPGRDRQEAIEVYAALHRLPQALKELERLLGDGR